jgi:hypothetical protein
VVSKEDETSLGDKERDFRPLRSNAIHHHQKNMNCRYETEHWHETRIHHVAGALWLWQQKKIRVVAACVNDRGGNQDDALADTVVRSLDQGKEQRHSVD